MEDKKNKVNFVRVVLFAAILVIAYEIGGFTGGSGFSGNTFPREFSKLGEIVRLVRASYVDSPDLTRMTEGSIVGLLEELDPHSVYIPVTEQTRIAERFAGEFSGIGIQFEIIDDQILVVSPIPGTPADRMGLRAGDRIIKIDGVSTFGITNEEVFSRLRGPRGSKVTITVVQLGEPEPFDLELTRDKIPIHSVDASFMLGDGVTGYVVINQFTSVTSKELRQALIALRRQGMKQLILDLRGNTGGYLGQADEVADKFISAGKVIVSTEGRIRRSNDVLHATSAPTEPYYPLIILVNRGSASASEIVAGAIQDHDRGLIIGQPTFGKGLVQSPFELEDGSVVRITTARWYTPSGRCVQRPYDDGIGEYLLSSNQSDSSLLADTADVETFLTRTGRKVFAEKGIRPDYIVDPGKLSLFGAKLIRGRKLFEWARDEADRMKEAPMPFEEFRDNWTLSKSRENAFIRFVKSSDLEFDNDGWKQDRTYLLTQIKAEIAQRLYNGRTYLWQILVTDDAQVETALEKMQEADELAKRP